MDNTVYGVFARQVRTAAGSVAVTDILPDNTSGRCAYLMSIYVRDAFRRRGIGGSIVNRLINEARNRLAGKIYLETSSMGEPLYLHAGFEPMEGMLKLKH